MTPTADATIAAPRSTHDELTAVVRGLSDDQLRAPSGSREWPVAQALSHLGSGAEISAATLGSALVEAVEALTPQQRAGLPVDLGFLPAPVTLATCAGMRLTPGRTPEGVRVSGDLGLEDLHRVFPGY